MKIKNEEELFNAIYKCKYFSNSLYRKGENDSDYYVFGKYCLSFDLWDRSFKIKIITYTDEEYSCITTFGKILVKLGIKKESDYLRTTNRANFTSVGFIRNYKESDYYKRVDDVVLFKEFVEIVGNVYDLYLLDEKKKIEEKEKEELENKKQDEFIFGVNE